MLMKEGLLVTANARIAPIATTVSPVPVLIGRFYPLAAVFVPLRRNTRAERVRRVHAEVARGASTTDSSWRGCSVSSHTCAGHSTFAEVVNRYLMEEGLIVEAGVGTPWPETTRHTRQCVQCMAKQLSPLTCAQAS